MMEEKKYLTRTETVKFLRTTNIHEVGTLCMFSLTVAI